MKNYVLPLLSLFAGSYLQAQTPNLSWVQHIAGPTRELATGINLDASGNLYSSGYFNGTADFDPGPATQTLTALGSMAGYISKYNAQGNMLWTTVLNPPVTNNLFNSRIVSQALCSNGDIYVSGYFEGVIDFDPSPTYTLLVTQQPSNAFIAKYDANGNNLWAKRITGNIGQNYATAVAVDAANNVYATGFFIDTTDFDPGIGTYTLTSQPGNHPDVFVLKLDAAGNFAWAKNLNTTGGGGSGNDITADASGNIYSTGSIIGAGDFDPGVGTHTLSSVGSEQDSYIWKLDASGNFVWAKLFGGAGKDAGLSMALDANSNVFLSGFYEGSGDFDPGTGTVNLTSVGLNDIYYSKFDTQGNLLWNKSIGGTDNDVTSAIVLDASNNIYSTGYFKNTVNFNAGAAGSYTLTSQATNAFISKMDGNGDLKWVSHFNGPSYSGGSALALGSGGSLFAAGSFSVNTDFDPNNSTYTLSSSNSSEDAFVLKLQCAVGQDLSVSSSATTICAGQSVTLTASGATTYTWNANNSTAVLVVNPSGNTTYTVTSTDVNGCNGMASITQMVSACTGLAEHAKTTFVTLYPNPAKNLLTVNAATEGNITVQIINMAGEVITTAQSEGSQVQLSTEYLPAGLYFVNVLQNNRMQAQLKLIKE